MSEKLAQESPAEVNDSVAEIREAVRQMSVLMANMYYFLTKEIVETYGEGAKEAISRGIVQFGLDRGRKIAEKAQAAGDELTIENLDKHYDMPITTGWDLHRTYGNCRKKNITDSCIFAEVWKEWDWAEVGHCYCLVDEAIRQGYNPHVVFKPVKNILLGDDCCESLTVYE